MEKRMDKEFQSAPEQSGEKQPIFSSELWFTAKDDDLDALRLRLEKGELTATVRLGDRSSGTNDPKGGYGEGRYIMLKLQRADRSFDEFQKEVIVLSSEVKKLGNILPQDLNGTLFGGGTKEELQERLENVYGRTVSDEDLLTIVKFDYQDALKSAEDLMRDKILSLAKQPKSNPENLNFEKYTLPLIEHDYPAKTATMWNAVYEKFKMRTGNNMLVGNPEFAGQILEILRRDPKYLGGGAGVGFKDEVIKHLDELDDLACAIGSVNFILKTPEGKLKGYNTDGIGYAKSLEEIFKERNENLEGKKAVILGAGGTGNAIVLALAERGMKIVILNRTVEKAKELAEKVNKYFDNNIATFGGEDRIAEEVKDADAVINVSTKGSAGDLKSYSALAPSILPASPENIKRNIEGAERIFGFIHEGAVMSDIVLAEKETPFLRAAREKGFRTLDGVPMVINQGVEAFWILHGAELQEKSVTKDQVAEVMKKTASEKAK